MRYLLPIALAALFWAGTPPALAQHLREVPKEIDFSAKYLFYLHGAWIERHGLDRPNPFHGVYEYDRIVQTFVERGFSVISEPRLSSVSMAGYARQVAEQASRLLSAGVPPEQITVIGHSRGGMMTLLAAGFLGEPGVNFVVLAGCGKEGTEFHKSFQRFLRLRAGDLKGRVLSIYDDVDETSGSCRQAFGTNTGLLAQERVLKTGKGHGLFYSPDPVWVNLVEQWAAAKIPLTDDE